MTAQVSRWIAYVAIVLAPVAIWPLLRRIPSTWIMPLALSGGGLLILALWKIPQLQVADLTGLEEKERFDHINEARKTLAQILGGALLLLGFLGTWQNIRVAQESLVISQKSALTSQESLELSRQGQITDRFTKAMEEFGAADAKGQRKLEVRLGGIYSLERIAKDSQRDHWTIMEAFCTYVRENAPRKPHDSGGKEQPVDLSVHSRADIQTVITVLGRRDRKDEGDDQVLRLANSSLRGVDFRKADFARAEFRSAHLRWADLTGANFSMADLRSADLIAATLWETNLEGAYLSGADLSGARYLTQKQLDSANGDASTRLPDYLQMPEKWKE
jgi:hypothetical protein